MPVSASDITIIVIVIPIAIIAAATGVKPRRGHVEFNTVASACEAIGDLNGNEGRQANVFQEKRRQGVKIMRVRTTAIAMGAAIGLVLVAASAGAQQYYTAPPEEVIVTAPPHAHERSAIGAPIIDASMSQTVRIDDLDLRTNWGVRRLRDRVGFAATTLCSRLNTMYPVTYDGGSDQWPRDHDCYRDAFNRAMVQADAAISTARGYDYR